MAGAKVVFVCPVCDMEIDCSALKAGDNGGCPNCGFKFDMLEGERDVAVPPTFGKFERAFIHFEAKLGLWHRPERRRVTAALKAQFWSIAEREVAERRFVPGLRAQAFTESDGDERRATARYLHIRVKQLADEYLSGVR
jgi:DNA-directed RNA polymerase subunit RPC12/RpoP